MAPGRSGSAAAPCSTTARVAMSVADAAEQVAAHLDAISDRTGETVPESGAAQGTLEVARAIAAHR